MELTQEQALCIWNSLLKLAGDEGCTVLETMLSQAGELSEDAVRDLYDSF